jgi:hypothetical protein
MPKADASIELAMRSMTAEGRDRHVPPLARP